MRSRDYPTSHPTLPAHGVQLCRGFSGMKSFVNKSKWAKKVGLTTEHDSVRPPSPSFCLFTHCCRGPCVLAACQPCSHAAAAPVLCSYVPLHRTIRQLLGLFVGCQAEQCSRDCRDLSGTHARDFLWHDASASGSGKPVPICSQLFHGNRTAANCSSAWT